MSLALVVAVQLIVVGFEEGGVLVSRGFVVDVLYGIQAETIYSPVNPALGRLHHLLESSILLQICELAIVQVGKSAGIEVRVVVPRLHKAELNVGSRTVIEHKCFTQLKGTSRCSTILRTTIPSRIAGTNQETPIGIKVYSKLIFSIPLIVELFADILTIPNIFGILSTGIWVVSIHCSPFSHGDSWLRRIGPIKYKGIYTRQAVRIQTITLTTIVTTSPFTSNHLNLTVSNILGRIC